jgi:aromatase
VERSKTYEVAHRAVVLAPAGFVYRLVADVDNWPRIFAPVVHVEREEPDGDVERARVWTNTAAGVQSWVARRSHYPDRLRVDYRQETSQPPVADMGGAWVVEPRGGAECVVSLLHDYTPAVDDPDTLGWIAKVLDTNSEAELAALKTAAELEAVRPDLVVTFDDTVRVAAKAPVVYDFLHDIQHWPDRLPQIESVSLDHDAAGAQVLRMQTRTREGTLHPTHTVRVCVAPTKIAYKQLLVPPLATVHIGQWLVRPTTDGTEATSRHTVVIKESGIPALLGAGTGAEQARAFVREALGSNSRVTLEHAKAFAQAG